MTALLGTDHEVPVALGGARWSLTATPDERAARATLYAALEAGVTVIDTAPAYTSPPHVSHNEHLIGDALRHHRLRDHVFLITKCGHTRDTTGVFHLDARPATIARECRASLKALGRERIDLYLLHWPDPDVPLAESVGALVELRAAGLVAGIGVCNVDLDQLRGLLGSTRLDAVENKLSLLAASDLPTLAECERQGLAYLAYSPLGGPGGAAWLARQGHDSMIGAIAAAHGASAQQVALAWLLACSPAVIAIVGAGQPGSIASAVAATALTLSDEELSQLRRVEATWN